MQYEEQLRDITRTQWNTHYLTNEALVNKRCDLFQYKILGVKIGSIVGRVCKFLHLDTFECVRKFFICSDLSAASRIIKETILLTNRYSKCSSSEKQALFDAVAMKVNNLIEYVNLKRSLSEKIPAECFINVTKLLAINISPKGDVSPPPPLALAREPSTQITVLPPSPSPAPTPVSVAASVPPQAVISTTTCDEPKPAALEKKKRTRKQKQNSLEVPQVTRRMSARLIEKRAKASRM